MNSIDITNTTISYPKPGSDAVAKLDVSAISPILDKIGEVATVNKTTAPRLMAEFNFAYAETNKLITFLRYEKDRAENLLNLRRSEVLLDISGEVIRAKGQSPNKELRDAVVCLDKEYQKLLEDRAQLEALVKFLEGQLKALEFAYQSVKKIYSDQTNPISYDFSRGH